MLLQELNHQTLTVRSIVFSDGHFLISGWPAELHFWRCLIFAYLFAGMDSVSAGTQTVASSAVLRLRVYAFPNVNARWTVMLGSTRHLSWLMNSATSKLWRYFLWWLCMLNSRRGKVWEAFHAESCLRQDPLEAILVIFGCRALIFFFVWKLLEKYEKWHHFCAPWRRKNVEKGHLAPSNLTFFY